MQLTAAVAAQVGKEPQPVQLTAAGAGQAGKEPQPVQLTAAGSGQAGQAGREPRSGQPQAPGALGETRDAKDVEVIRQLAARDAEVRAHEAAHAAAGGTYAGSPSFGFQRGPDGKSYAVSGEVPIDISSIPGDPAATIAKMQQVKRAALAPASPSGADRSIAAAADASIAAARAELFANGGKAASEADATDPTDKTRREPSAVGASADAGAAGALSANADEDTKARQAAALAPGDLARELTHRHAGATAYRTSSARNADGVVSATL